jgi:hypothetical protein
MLQLKLILVGFAIFLLPLTLFAQVFVAGQTAGGNITHDDFSDINLSAFSIGSQDAVSIDLNNDNSEDIYFWTQWVYYSHTGYESANAGANPFDGIEISTMPDNPNWIRKHSAGDVIDNSLNWSPDNGIFYCISSTGTDGSFGGSGFMAYRICGPDTIYGWIKLNRGTFLGPSDLSITELAYIVNYTGLDQPAAKPLSDFLSISGHSLILELPDEFKCDQYLLDCYDLSGRTVFQAHPGPGTHHYDLSRLGKGTYIIRLINSKGESSVIKAIF